jgi:hypothetical protein
MNKQVTITSPGRVWKGGVPKIAIKCTICNKKITRYAKSSNKQQQNLKQTNKNLWHVHRGKKQARSCLWAWPAVEFNRKKSLNLTERNLKPLNVLTELKYDQKVKAWQFIK